MSLEELKQVRNSEIKTQGCYWFGNEKFLGKKKLKLPVTLGIRKAYIETEVIEGKIPWLIGTNVLKKLGGVIDTKNMELHCQLLLVGERIKLKEDKIGHLRIKLRNWKMKDKVWLNIKSMNEKEWKEACRRLHLQFGHCSFDKLIKMVKQGLKGEKSFTDDEKNRTQLLKDCCEKCDICLKFKRNPGKPVVGLPLTNNFNDVLCLDIGEIDGNKFLVMVDWATRYCQSKWVKSKKPKEMFESVLDRWVSIFGPPKRILTDGGREFQNEEFVEFTECYGIELICTSSESPWSNGKCEKMVGLLKEGLKKLKEDGLNEREWALLWIINAKNDTIMEGGFSPNQKVFGQNTTKWKDLECMSPSELEETNESSRLGELIQIQRKVRDIFTNTECRNRIKRALKERIRSHPINLANIGDYVYYKREKEKQWKGPGKIIGVDGKTVLVKHGGLLRNVHRIHITRIGENYDKKTIEETEDEDIEEESGSGEDANEESDSESSEDLEEREEMEDEEDGSSGEEEVKINYREVKIGHEYLIRKEEDDWWRRVKIKSLGGKRGGKYDGAYNVVDIDSKEEYWADLQRHEIMGISEEEEENYRREDDEIYYSYRGEIELDKTINNAKEKELQSWKSNNVYDEVDGVKDMFKVIKTRWIITDKEREGVKICKARLVAKGFMDEKQGGLDKEAPTSSVEGIKFILMIIKLNRWEIKSLDIRTAYLQGWEIKREVYLKPPIEAKTKKIWKLKKAVYGLNDAARVWYDCLIEFLKSIGGEVSGLDNTIIKWRKEDRIIGIMGIHVDDLIYGGEEGVFEKEVIRKLQDRFMVGKEEKGQFKFLGLNIQDSGEDITINQHHYIQEQIALPFVCKKVQDRKLELKEQTMFRSILGKLNWVSQNTRPDLSFDVSVLGRKMQEASYEDLREIVKVGNRIKEKNFHVIIPYLKPGKMYLEIFADASFGNIENGRTQIGYVIWLKDCMGNKSPLVWKSRVAKRVVGSTLAAETLSIVEAVEWGVYLKYLWEETMGSNHELDIIVKTDCKSVKEALNAKTGVKNRMLRIEMAGLKEKLDEGIIKRIEWIASRDQAADCLTKKRGGSILRLIGREI